VACRHAGRNVSRDFVSMNFLGRFREFRNCASRFSRTGGVAFPFTIGRVDHAFMCALMWWSRKTHQPTVSILRMTHAGPILLDSLVLDADARGLLSPNCFAPTHRIRRLPVLVRRTHPENSSTQKLAEKDRDNVFPLRVREFLGLTL